MPCAVKRGSVPSLPTDVGCKLNILTVAHDGDAGDGVAAAIGGMAEILDAGGTVLAIKFSVKEKPSLVLPSEPPQEQLTLQNFEETSYSEIYDPDDPLAMAADMLPPEFTREQVQLLKSLAADHVPYTVASFAEKDLWIADYLNEKTQLMNATPGVKSKFGWLKQAVAENWK